MDFPPPAGQSTLGTLYLHCFIVLALADRTLDPVSEPPNSTTTTRFMPHLGPRNLANWTKSVDYSCQDDMFLVVCNPGCWDWIASADLAISAIPLISWAGYIQLCYQL